MESALEGLNSFSSREKDFIQRKPFLIAKREYEADHVFEKTNLFQIIKKERPYFFIFTIENPIKDPNFLSIAKESYGHIGYSIDFNNETIFLGLRNDLKSFGIKNGFDKALISKIFLDANALEELIKIIKKRISQSPKKENIDLTRKDELEILDLFFD